MHAHSIVAIAAALITAANALAVEQRAEPVAGLCTIGVDHFIEDIPDPVAGTSTPITGMQAYIVGTDGKQTDEKVYPDQPNQNGGTVHADGTYGGLSGGVWHLATSNPLMGSISYCVISFTGRNDHADQTLDSRNEPSNVCDLYSYGVASVTTGCRCRFPCR